MKKTITTLLGFYLNILSFILPRKAARLGLQIFFTPLRMPMRDYHLKFLRAAEQFSIELNGVTLQGYRWGNGKKKILFIHGWQSHSFQWKAYIEAFSKEDYTLYAFDAPGHGLSGGRYISVPYYTDVIRQVVTTIGPLQAIVAHSLGSFSSLYAYYVQPDFPVCKLVLMAPPGEANDFILFYKHLLKLTDKTINLIVDHFTTQIGKPITFFSTATFAPSVHVPCLIIHDENDTETPVQNSIIIHKAIEKSMFIRTKGFGHNLKSPSVVKEVVGFVNDSEHAVATTAKDYIPV